MESTVTTVGIGSVSTTPDALRLDLSVRHGASSIADALAGCASGVEALRAVARDFVADDEVATRNFYVGQRYGDPVEPVSYEATHTVEVLCSGFDRAGDLVAALADEIGDRLQIEAFRPTVTDPAPLMVQARERAFHDARAKADELAALAGQVVLNAVRVVEGSDRAGWEHPEAAMAASRTSFEPGRSLVSATVTVTWSTEQRA